MAARMISESKVASARKPKWVVVTQVCGVICIGLGLGYPWWSSWRESVRAAVTEVKLPTRKLRPAMILLPVGKFRMGGDGFDEKPIHEVELTTPFAMSETEVTQAQYEAVMGKNPASFGQESDTEDRPVELVSWFDAIEYCNKLSEQEGLERCYKVNEEVEWSGPSCKGYRLPTEAEWEYAARADEGTEYAGSDKAEDVAWFGEDFDKGGTHPVKRKQPNQWGLYDLSGNVWEWVWDLYRAGYEAQPRKDPLGPPKPSEGVAARVFRGGSWLSTATDARVAERSASEPVFRSYNLGFRLVRSYP